MFINMQQCYLKSLNLRQPRRLETPRNSNDDDYLVDVWTQIPITIKLLCVAYQDVADLWNLQFFLFYEQVSQFCTTCAGTNYKKRIHFNRKISYRNRSDLQPFTNILWSDECIYKRNENVISTVYIIETMLIQKLYEMMVFSQSVSRNYWK